MKIYDFIAADLFFSIKSCAAFEDEEEGVYIFSSFDNEILYVGASKNINKRLNNHRLNLERFENRVHKVAVLTGMSGGEVFRLEKTLIEQLQPIYNEDVSIHYNKMPRF